MSTRTACLHLFRATQALWALALLMFVAPLITRHNELSLFVCLLLISFLAYAIASFGIFWDSRWAWILSIAFLAGYWILMGWIGLVNLVVNFYMFFSGHELYRDSLLTILVVVAHATLGILPAGVLLILGVICRRHIFEALKGQHETSMQTPD